MIASLFSELRQREWPTLNVGSFSKNETYFLVVFYLSQLGYSIYTFLNGPRAEFFLYPFIFPIFFLLIKHRLFFPLLIISAQISSSFLAIGNGGMVFKIVAAAFLLFAAIASYQLGFYLLSVVQFFYYIPTVYGYSAEHLLLIVILISMSLRKEEMRFSTYKHSIALNKFLLLFWVWITLAGFWGPSLPTVVMGYIDLMLSIFLYYFLTVQFVEDEKRMLNVLKTWVIAGFFVSFFFFVVPETTTPGMDTEIHKNWSSSLLNFSTFSLLTFFALREKIVMRIAMYFVFVWILTVNFVLGSRAGLISMILCIILFYILKNPWRKKWKFFVLRLSTGFFVIFLLAQIPLVPTVYVKLGSMTSLLQIPESMQTIVFRFQQWEFGQEIIEDNGNIWMGAGINAYTTYYSDYYEMQYGKRPEARYTTPHSLYVAVYVNYGIIGLTIFVLIIVAFFISMTTHILRTKNYRYRIISTAIYCTVYSFMIHSLIDWSLIDRRLWLFLGLGMAMIFIDRREGYQELLPPPKKKKF